MNTKRTPDPAKHEIERGCNAIRRSWNRDERERRQQAATLRQQWLCGVLQAKGAALPAAAV